MGELAAWKGGKLVGGTIARFATRVASMDREAEIGASSALIERDACEAIIAEADAALEPCGDEVGKRQATIMLAVFAGARAGQRQDSPEDAQARDIYVRAISTALARMPEAVARQVVDDVVMTHRFGNPLPADITARAEAIMTPIRDAQFIAWRHQREHTRRDAERRKREAEDARIAANPVVDRSAMDALLARLGAGVKPDAGPPRPKSQAQRLADTLSAVDRAAYWRLVGEGVAPEEAARRAPMMPVEAAE